MNFFDKQLLTVSRLQFVRLKACLPNCITHRPQNWPSQSWDFIPVSRKNRSRPRGTPPFAAVVRLISSKMCCLFTGGKATTRPKDFPEDGSAAKGAEGRLNARARLSCHPLYESG